MGGGGGLFSKFYGIHFLHNEEHQYFLGDIKFHNTLDSLLVLQKKKNELTA